jgi:hypothetical protein
MPLLGRLRSEDWIDCVSVKHDIENCSEINKINIVHLNLLFILSGAYENVMRD